MKTTQFAEKLRSSIVYLWEDESQCFIKSLPAGPYLAKYPGRQEFEIAADSDIVTRALARRDIRTAAEYNKA